MSPEARSSLMHCMHNFLIGCLCGLIFNLGLAPSIQGHGMLGGGFGGFC
jgi:hypothetical protein